MILRSAILVQCRQTDRQTHDDIVYRARIASRGNNGRIISFSLSFLVVRLRFNDSEFLIISIVTDTAVDGLTQLQIDVNVSQH